MAKKSTPSYQKAFDELKQISAQIETGEIGIDELSTLVKRAKLLVKTCQLKLRQTEDELNQDQ